MKRRITVVGGGPAGLYFAYLVKKARPADRVLVLERNRRDATYGFGVVLSSTALDRLRAIDPPSHARIIAQVEQWDDQTIVHRDQVIRLRGSGFAGISRLNLLATLQELCESKGVELRFGVEADHPNALANECDVLVGADGVNSRVRDAGGFGTQVQWLSNRFAWYGVDRAFDTHSLTFRHAAGGAFVAHHYRYTPTTSTFLVECDERSWRQCGLDGMDEAARKAFCEAIFAADLLSRPLISNNTQWRQFPVVTNDTWHNGKSVLIGDALRSAHFSIGSGTRLAMEDAASLAMAMAAHDDPTKALSSFDATRRPEREKLSSAAERSFRWYENFAEHMMLDPLAFVHAYLTRSGRVDDARLRRDWPDFMRMYDAQHRSLALKEAL